jgi:multisubunit Na+/H+ antiporter MnhF subunit
MRHLLPFTLAACSLLLAFSVFLCLIRLRRGPTIMDRILAFDTICVLIVGFMVVLSARWHSALYLDLILVFTLLGFFSTVAFSLYLHRSYDLSHDHPELLAPKKARRRRRA